MTDWRRCFFCTRTNHAAFGAHREPLTVHAKFADIVTASEDTRLEIDSICRGKRSKGLRCQVELTEWTTTFSTVEKLSRVPNEIRVLAAHSF